MAGIADKLMHQMLVIEETTGKKPDSLWLSGDDWDEFLSQMAEAWKYSPYSRARAPTEDDLKFMGIPVKEAIVER